MRFPQAHRAPQSLTTNETAPEPLEPYRSLKGLHLYHAVLSNCSQRVRLMLEEKALEWTSHPINLMTNEHLDADYQRLNPEGVVPTLVHDGRIVTDSNQILRYIEQQFPKPPMFPSQPAEIAVVDRFLTMSSALQKHLKLLTFSYLFPPNLAKKSPDELAEYARLQGNKRLVDWMRRFSEGEFTEADLIDARDSFVRDMQLLDSYLQDHDWLSGDRYGLADVSWTVNVDRARLIAAATGGMVDPAEFQSLSEWFDRVSHRPSFDKALTDYLPEAPVH